MITALLSLIVRVIVGAFAFLCAMLAGLVVDQVRHPIRSAILILGAVWFIYLR